MPVLKTITKVVHRDAAGSRRVKGGANGDNVVVEEEFWELDPPKEEIVPVETKKKDEPAAAKNAEEPQQERRVATPSRQTMPPTEPVRRRAPSSVATYALLRSMHARSAINAASQNNDQAPQPRLQLAALIASLPRRSPSRPAKSGVALRQSVVTGRPAAQASAAPAPR